MTNEPPRVVSIGYIIRGNSYNYSLLYGAAAVTSLWFLNVLQKMGLSCVLKCVLFSMLKSPQWT